MLAGQTWRDTEERGGMEQGWRTRWVWDSSDAVAHDVLLKMTLLHETYGWASWYLCLRARMKRKLVERHTGNSMRRGGGWCVCANENTRGRLKVHRARARARRRSKRDRNDREKRESSLIYSLCYSLPWFRLRSYIRYLWNKPCFLSNSASIFSCHHCPK